jgi:putative transposase
MPRRARLRLAGLPLHIIQRGNNRTACFFADKDCAFYLHHLGELSREFHCALHAYVLMTNHVHLLLTPAYPDGPSLLMKHLGQRYVQYVNRAYQRSGTLWEGRFRSSIVQEQAYFLRCHCYIELNPVRANMVSRPGDHRWSSFAANAGLATSRMLTPHSEYLALGRDRRERGAAYRDLFRWELGPAQLDEIRSAANGGFALGNDDFRAQVTGMLKRRAERGAPGRPRKDRLDLPDPADQTG